MAELSPWDEAAAGAKTAGLPLDAQIRAAVAAAKDCGLSAAAQATVAASVALEGGASQQEQRNAALNAASLSGEALLYPQIEAIATKAVRRAAKQLARKKRKAAAERAKLQASASAWPARGVPGDRCGPTRGCERVGRCCSSPTICILASFWGAGFVPNPSRIRVPMPMVPVCLPSVPGSVAAQAAQEPEKELTPWEVAAKQAKDSGFSPPFMACSRPPTRPRSHPPTRARGNQPASGSKEANIAAWHAAPQSTLCC